MAISNYTELQTAVASWLARDDLTARIPEFITLAEAKLNRELRCRQMETRVSDTTTASDDFLDLPTGFQTMRRIRLSGVTGKPRLVFLSGTQIEEYRYGHGNAEGQPLYWSIVGDEIELLPTPDDEYAVEMIYRKYMDLATDSTNWLLTLAPDAYLYGALLESAPYINEDARIATWGLGLKVAIDGLNRLSQDFGTSPLEMRLSGPTP